MSTILILGTSEAEKIANFYVAKVLRDTLYKILVTLYLLPDTCFPKIAAMLVILSLLPDTLVYAYLY